VSAEFRVGPWLVEPSLNTISSNGTTTRLEPKVMEVLVCLARHPDEALSKEHLVQTVWPDTFVSDDNLKRCISELRRVLEDDARDPHIIQTIPKRGYRLLAPVQPIDGRKDFAALTARVSVDGRLADTEATKPWTSGAAFRVSMVTLACATLVAVALAFVLRSPTPPKVVSSAQITNDAAAKESVYTSHVAVSDGTRVYFQEKSATGWIIAQVAANGGEVTRVPSPFENANVFDISRDRSQLLIGTSLGSSRLNALWVLALPSGSPRRVGDLFVSSASWSPDGKLIAYCKGSELYVAEADGSESQKLASVSGIPYQPRWSPDGTELRFSVYDPSRSSSALWNVSRDGSNLHPLFSHGHEGQYECCGVWTPDGKYFSFESGGSIWSIRESKGWFHKTSPEPVQLTSTAAGFEAPSLSPDGKKLFVFQRLARGELMRYNRELRQFVPFLSGLSAEHLDFSPDHEWLAYVTLPEADLWRCRVDGSQRLQLTHGMQVAFPRWSPDGSQIAFGASKAGEPWKLNVISRDGGAAQQLIPGEGPEQAPNWFPDGNSLVFGEVIDSTAPVIHLVNLKSHQVSRLPGSTGLFLPRVSPDGRYIAAMTLDSMNLLLFNVASHKWEKLIQGRFINNPTWSGDGQYVFFSDPDEPGSPFYRVRIDNHKLERVAVANLPRGLPFGISGRWTGLAPDDSPMLIRDTSIEEIYALTINWP